MSALIENEAVSQSEPWEDFALGDDTSVTLAPVGKVFAESSVVLPVMYSQKLLRSNSNISGSLKISSTNLMNYRLLLNDMIISF